MDGGEGLLERLLDRAMGQGPKLDRGLGGELDGTLFWGPVPVTGILRGSPDLKLTTGSTLQGLPYPGSHGGAIEGG